MPAKPIQLNVLKVAQAAKKAFDEGRLSAQGPTPMCAYRDDSGRPCAIGAALTDRQAKALDDAGEFSATGVVKLLREGRIKTDSPDDLSALQATHDDWAVSVSGRRSAQRIEHDRAAFVRVLGRILGEAA